MGDIAAKESLDELTPTQQRVVEATVTVYGRDADPTGLAEETDAARAIADEADASSAYTREVLRKYPHLVEQFAEARNDQWAAEAAAEETDTDEAVSEETTDSKSDTPETETPMSDTQTPMHDETDPTDTTAESESESEQSQSKLAANRVEVPGRATVHDKRTHDSDKEIDHFACPFCDYTDTSERVVRTHITRESDSKHKNRNGFLDQIYVNGVAVDGTVVEDTAAPKTEEYNGVEQTAFIPDEVDPDSRAGEILEEAIKYPSKGAMDIARSVYGDAGDNPYVYKVISQHLSTKQAEGRQDSGAVDRKGWKDLTDKQRAVIRAWLSDPSEDRSMSDVEREADVSTGYARTVLEKYRYIADHIQVRLEANALSRDDLTDDATLPINFDNPAPGEVPQQATDTDTGTPAEPAAGGEPTTATAEPAAPQATADVVCIEKAHLREFAATVDTLRQSAEVDAEIAPRDSEMAVASRKALHVIDHVEGFLRKVADGTAAAGPDSPPQDGSDDGDAQ